VRGSDGFIGTKIAKNLRFEWVFPSHRESKPGFGEIFAGNPSADKVKTAPEIVQKAQLLAPDALT